MKIRLVPVALAIVVMALLVAAIWWQQSQRTTAVAIQPADPAPDAALAYVGSQSCAECHAAEYKLWQTSQHAVAIQVADARTVIGDFSGARLRQYGVGSEFFRRADKYLVRTDGPDGKTGEFEVRHTFGVYPLQQYLVELPGGRVQALPLAWDARPKEKGGQRWFHLYPDEEIAHGDELHWTRRQQNWNFMCADCHSTNVQKQYDAANDSYATRWSEISVGCEACHGPGGRHVALARVVPANGAMSSSGLTVDLDERHGVAWTLDPASGNATRGAPRTRAKELDVCAQCHSRRGQYSNDYRPGEPFLDHYLPSLLSAGLYHPDGQQRDEVFNWGSFLSSRMYDQGVTCGDCHDPHGGKLRASGNAVCAQCHSAAKFDQPDHHFHETGTAGAACVSCHMKTETYMVVDPRHDHSFRIPRPDLSVTLGVPNACNQCHTDRSASWAVGAVRKRYPDPKPGFQGFAEAFAAADRGDPVASIALTQVAANQAESAIARASAIDRLGDIPGENSLLAAEAALEDESALVRRAAASVFDTVAPQERRALLPLLADPARIVRMQVARSLTALAASGALDDMQLAAYRSAADEYVAAERFNADRPEHRTNLGGFYAESGITAAAEAEYRSALKLDPEFAPAWVNLADLLRMLNRESEAEATLRAGLERVPRDATLHHALGLALVRQGRGEEALRELKLATQLAPGNERFAYVYNVARNELGGAGNK
jgi:predicted CXXCH cytochrome family protein